MASLLVFLDGCSQQGKAITELVYCANTWDLGGVVNLQHHGVVLTIPAVGFFVFRLRAIWSHLDVVRCVPWLS
jgi:hypothetical protein